MKKPLRIAFLLESNPVTGGTRVVLTIADGLIKRGHDVRILMHFCQSRYFPSKVPIEQISRFRAALRRRFDLAVATHVSQIPELAGRLKIPLLWFIQGYEGFFRAKNPEELIVDRFPSVRDTYRIPIPKVVPSESLRNFLLEHFGSRVSWIPLGLDRRWFFKEPGVRKKGAKRIMVLGPSRWPLKGIDHAFRAFEILKKKGAHFTVVYISSQEEDPRSFARFPFPVELHVRPPQGKLAGLYRSADVFVSPSWYEAFPFPPLEAMASGTPVVAYGNSGIQNYGVDGRNCLLARIGNASDLARKMELLFESKSLRNRLIEEGRKTANQVPTWDEGAKRFEEIARKEIEEFKPNSIRLSDSLRQSLEKGLQEGGFLWTEEMRRHLPVIDRLYKRSFAVLKGQ